MSASFAVGLLLGLLGTVPLAKSQEEPSKVDLYGGYYYARFNVKMPTSPGLRPRQHTLERAGVVNSSTTPKTGSEWWAIWAAFMRPAAGTAHLPEECSPTFLGPE